MLGSNKKKKKKNYCTQKQYDEEKPHHMKIIYKAHCYHTALDLSSSLHRSKYFLFQVNRPKLVLEKFTIEFSTFVQ